jgi:ATP-dependent protease ClpP protease subunit
MTTYPIRARIRAEGESTRVDVMDDIGEDPWFGGGLSAASFAGQLAGVRGPLDVHISSQGGVVSDGLAIYNALLQHPAPVSTFVDGYAASIASVIAQAGGGARGGRRVMAPASAMMIHDPWGYAEGNQADFLRVAGALGVNGDVIAQAYATRAGGTVDQWRQVMQAERWYTPEEAVAAGLADEVATEVGAPSQLPRGLDLDALAARAPERIMARLRAAAPAAPDGDGGDGDSDGKPPCKTCDGKGRLPHPGTGKNGAVCPSCGGSKVYDPSGVPGDDGDPSAPPQDGPRNAAGRPYEPQPYHRTSDENVQCPACQKFSDDDARYCGQCATQLVGRTDVREAPLVPAASAGQARPRAAAGAAAEDCPTCEGTGKVRDGHVKCPDCEGTGKVPGDGAQDAAQDQMWAMYRQAVRDAGGKVDNSPWDGSKAMHNGAGSDDPAAFYAGICAGEKAGDKSTQDAWALPYKYHPGDPPNAAGVKDALARLPQTEGLTNEAGAKKTLQAAMKQVNPDWEPDDHAGTGISAADAVERYRAALKGARA